MQNTVTKEIIEGKIKEVTYTVLPSGKSIVCEITLQNGFSVRGDSAVVDKANFDKEIGQRIAYARAFDKIWQVEGYLLQQKLYEQE
mgnify:CR=1 FL=1